MPPKKADERVLFDKFENLNERLDSLVKTAESKSETGCQPTTAKILATAIQRLYKEHEESYNDWVLSTSISEEKFLSTKKTFNRLAMKCDNILVNLQIAAGSVDLVEVTTKTDKPRLPKIEFRPFESGKGNPKLWFEQLEVVLKTMAVSSQDQKFALCGRSGEGKRKWHPSKRVDGCRLISPSSPIVAPVNPVPSSPQLPKPLSSLVTPSVRASCDPSTHPSSLVTPSSRASSHPSVTPPSHAPQAMPSSPSIHQVTPPSQTPQATPSSLNPIVDPSSVVSVTAPEGFLSPFQAGKFMVDSGSPVTIVPVLDVSQPSVDSGLRDASGNTIRTYGKRLVNVPIDGRIVPFQALCCNVVRPILGRDFFKGPGKDLLLDLSQDKIVNRINGYRGSSIASNDNDSVCALAGNSLNPLAIPFRTTSSLEAARKEAKRLVQTFVETQGPDDGFSPSLFRAH
ncbi:Hypothetical predicted protein [Paramuricea clavata]|uniref:Uncharacterized protein n=1 Tax=Paramuricea clavata TaxID=317549 RepID=A0A6S7KKZ0_PARCT|nr:Hypothetical predicted protein [Paramuricea clavata]